MLFPNVGPIIEKVIENRRRQELDYQLELISARTEVIRRAINHWKNGGILRPEIISPDVMQVRNASARVDQILQELMRPN